MQPHKHIDSCKVCRNIKVMNYLNRMPKYHGTHKHQNKKITSIMMTNFMTDLPNYAYIDGLVQDRRNSIANALSCTNPLTKCILHVTSHLTHWGRVTYICVSKLTIIGSDNGLSPGRRQAIIWTNAGILLIRPLGTNFNENASENVVCEIAFILSRPQCVKSHGSKLIPVIANKAMVPLSWLEVNAFLRKHLHSIE